MKIENIIHSKGFSIMVSFLPFLLITGPFLSDLLVSLTSIIFLIYLFLKKKLGFLNNSFFYFFIFFCIVFIISSLISTNVMLSFESSLFYFRIFTFSFLICYLINHNKKILIYFYNILLFCFSILIIDGYLQFIFGKNIFLMAANYGRISSFFGTELVLGSFLSRLFLLFFSLFLIKKKNYYDKYIIAIIFISLDVLIYITGERTAFLLLNISTIFIIIIIDKYKIFRLITFLISLIIIFGITFISENVRNRMVNKPINDFQSNFVKGENTTPLPIMIFSEQHTNIFYAGYRMFKSKPYLGHGPKLFRIICKEYPYNDKDTCSSHPHNFYLQLLAETGVIGFLFIIISFMYILKEAFLVISKQKKISGQEACLLGCFFLTLWPLSPNGNFFNNWLMIVYILPLGFYLNLKIYNKVYNNIS
jgi:O-antigen ligase